MPQEHIRILFLSSWYPSRTEPHLGNFVRKHAEAAALRCRVSALHVCSGSGLQEKKYDYTAQDIDGIFTVNVYYRKVRHSIPLLTQLQKLLRYKKAHRIGLELLEKHAGKPDLIHVNVLWPAGLAARAYKRKTGTPYIITEHSTVYLASRGYRQGFLEAFFSKRIARDASVITPVSRNLQQAMMKHGLHAPFEIVYNVVRTDIFKPAEQAPAKKKYRFLHISTLNDEHKNVSGILRAVAKLAEKRNDFEIRIMGEGDPAPHARYAKELGILGTFAFFDGVKTTEGVAEEMRHADCFVLFSNYENQPVVIAEAFACGIPVIATDVGGIAEHVNEARGLLVQAKNETALCSAMQQMLDNLNEGRYDKAALHTYAENNFSYEKVSARFHDIYLNVLQRHA